MNGIGIQNEGFDPNPNNDAELSLERIRAFYEEHHPDFIQNNNTLLYIAALFRYNDHIKFLLSEGHDISEKSGPYKVTPYQAALGNAMSAMRVKYHIFGHEENEFTFTYEEASYTLNILLDHIDVNKIKLPKGSGDIVDSQGRSIHYYISKTNEVFDDFMSVFPKAAVEIPRLSDLVPELEEGGYGHLEAPEQRPEVEVGGVFNRSGSKITMTKNSDIDALKKALRRGCDYIDLSNNFISDDGVYKVVDLVKGTDRPISINLSGNIIGDRGAMYISYLLPNMQDQMIINLNHNGITNLGVASIRVCFRNLRYNISIDLRNNIISKEERLKIIDAVGAVAPERANIDVLISDPNHENGIIISNYYEEEELNIDEEQDFVDEGIGSDGEVEEAAGAANDSEDNAMEEDSDMNSREKSIFYTSEPEQLILLEFATDEIETEESKEYQEAIEEVYRDNSIALTNSIDHYNPTEIEMETHYLPGELQLNMLGMVNPVSVF